MSINELLKPFVKPPFRASKYSEKQTPADEWKKFTPQNMCDVIKELQRLISIFSTMIRTPSLQSADYTKMFESMEAWRFDYFDSLHNLGTRFDDSSPLRWTVHDVFWQCFAHLYMLNETTQGEIHRVIKALDRVEHAPEPPPEDWKPPLWTDETYHGVILLNEIKLRLLSFHWRWRDDWMKSITIPDVPAVMDPQKSAKLPPGTKPPTFELDRVFDTQHKTAFGRFLSESGADNTFVSDEQLLYFAAAWYISSKDKCTNKPLVAELVAVAGLLHHARSVSKWLCEQGGVYSECASGDDKKLFDQARPKFETWLLDVCRSEVQTMGPQLRTLLWNFFTPAACSVLYVRLQADDNVRDHPIHSKLKTVLGHLTLQPWCRDVLTSRVDSLSQLSNSKLSDSKHNEDMYDMFSFVMFMFVFESIVRADFRKRYVVVCEETHDNLIQFTPERKRNAYDYTSCPIIVFYGQLSLIWHHPDGGTPAWIEATNKRDAALKWCFLILTQYDGRLEDGKSIVKFCTDFCIIVPPTSPPPQPPPPQSEPRPVSPSPSRFASQSKSPESDSDPLPCSDDEYEEDDDLTPSVSVARRVLIQKNKKPSHSASRSTSTLRNRHKSRSYSRDRSPPIAVAAPANDNNNSNKNKKSNNNNKH